MIYEFIVVFLIPLLASLVITPSVMKLAKLLGAIDYPNERKIHSHPIPRLGGFAIYTSFVISLYIFSHINPISTNLNSNTIFMLIGSVTFVLVLGIWDDIKELKPGKKFIGQCIAATIIYLAGFRISTITSFSGEMIYLGLLDYPITLVWIVGITNAFNLIDGLDGLASGVAAIAGITIFSISIIKGDIPSAILVLAFTGAIIGFIRYNFYNAKIFLGDSGSLVLGFSLAIFSMISKTKSSTAFSVLFPILVLGLPIMDTMLSMLRRFVRSISLTERSPSNKTDLKSIFYPDKNHIHHKLLSFGFSKGKAVIVLYIISVMFSAVAFTITIVNTLVAIPILVGIAVAIFVGITQLGYKEIALLRNGALLPIFERPLVKNSTFHFLLDFFAVFLSFFLATYFSTLNANSTYFINSESQYINYITVVLVQLLVFSIGGLYKITLKQLAFGDILKILKLIVISIFASWFFLSLIYQSPFHFPLTMYIFDFYFLVTFVLGGRISFVMLHYLAEKNNSSGDINVLIYGLPYPNGIYILDSILKAQNSGYRPVGILDDDPYFEGKHINGYKIVGNHWNLHHVLNTIDVKEIFVFVDNVYEEALNRVIKIASNYNIPVKKISFNLVNIKIGKPKKKLLAKIFEFEK